MKTLEQTAKQALLVMQAMYNIRASGTSHPEYIKVMNELHESLAVRSNLKPCAYVHTPSTLVEGKVRPVVSFEKYQDDYDQGIYSVRIPLYAIDLEHSKT